MTLDKDTLITIAGSGVVAGLVAAFVSLRINARNVKLSYITSERTKWRDKVRDIASEVHKNITDQKRLSELHSQLALNLSPFDPEDRAILKLLASPPTSEKKEATLTEFTQRLALLLKHDWQRAKWEASSIFTRRPFCPKRVTFEEFKNTNP